MTLFQESRWGILKNVILLSSNSNHRPLRHPHSLSRHWSSLMRFQNSPLSCPAPLASAPIIVYCIVAAEIQLRPWRCSYRPLHSRLPCTRSWVCVSTPHKLDMAACTVNPRVQEEKAGVQGYPLLHSKFKASLAYTRKTPCKENPNSVPHPCFILVWMS